jgi:hypothetical protein
LIPCCSLLGQEASVLVCVLIGLGKRADLLKQAGTLKVGEIPFLAVKNILALSMGWFQELQAILKTTAGQLTTSSHAQSPRSSDTREIRFAPTFQRVAYERRLTQEDALARSITAQFSKRTCWRSSTTGTRWVSTISLTANPDRPLSRPF